MKKQTHVLVPETLHERLRRLSKKMRIPQAALLQEAVDSLLVKYNRMPAPKAPDPTDDPAGTNEP